MGLLMAIATIVFFGFGGAALIVYVQDRVLQSVFTVQPGISRQIIAGLIGGSIIGAMAMFIVSRSGMKEVTNKYARMIGELRTTRSDRVMIGLCAGVGEELFFRGALQYWLGIPITAILFVAIHGYLDIRDRKIFLYGVFMTVVMLAFGYVAETYGLWAPIAAHMMIDIVLFEYLHYKSESLRSVEQLNDKSNEDV